MESTPHYTFAHDRNARPAHPVDHPADDPVEYAVSRHGLPHRIPALARLRSGADGSFHRTGSAAVVDGRPAGHSATGTVAAAAPARTRGAFFPGAICALSDDHRTGDTLSARPRPQSRA